MVDIKSVKDELVVPDVYVCFTALERITKKDGKQITKNHRYVFDAKSGKVYQRGHEPSLSSRTYYLATTDWSHRAWKQDSTSWRGYHDVRTAMVEWQYVPKYDVLALVHWVLSVDPTQEKNLEITNKIPNCGLVGLDADDALFRWTVPNDNMMVPNIIVIDHDKNILCETSEIWRHSWVNHFPDVIRSASNIRYTEHWEVVGNYFGRVFLGRNTYGIPNCPDNIALFLRAKKPKAKGGPKQEKVDGLTAISLAAPVITTSCNPEHYCYISRVNDEWAVVRWFQREASRIGGYLETYRIYVSKKEHLYCRNDGDGDFVYFGGKLSANTFSSDLTVMESEDVFKDTKLEYFAEIYKEITKDDVRAKALFMLINYPEFEKFWKAGLKEVCEDYLTTRWGRSWAEHIRPIFGVIDGKAKNLHAILGINKHQLEKSRSNQKVHISDIKRIFQTDDLRDIDDQSYDAVFDFLGLDAQSHNSHYYYYGYGYDAVRALEITKASWSSNTMLNVIPCLTKVYGQKVRVNGSRGYYYNNEIEAIRVYCDFVQMVVAVNGMSRIKPYFKTPEELVDMHNILVDVLNADEANARRLQEAALAKQFQERKEVWAKWEYDKNDKWVVIAPTAPLDLAQEGIELRHCVRSYIPKVAAGQTNIVFIREKDKQDVPFFTVEVLNNNSVRQIHGACNRNVCTEPGLEDFVKEWAKAVKVKVANYNSILA